MMAASSEQQQQMLHSLAGYFSHMPLSQGFRWPELLTTASGGGSKKKKNKEVVESSEQISSRSMKRKKKEAEDAEPASENPCQLPSITNEKRRKKDPADTSEKPDVIHVRARRGQATDSHSLAERARREKISERMKFLQDLVPGCKKITGKAGMLDEIINYVQSLQTQVQFLSMKLAAVAPAIDCDVDIESYLAKQMNSASNSVISQEMSSQMVAADASYLQLNALQHGFECPELDVADELSLSELALQRTTSAPMPSPDVFLDPLFNLTTFTT